MDIKQLKYFVKIVDCGSLSKAAKELNLSQPPLSKQLMMLERELGVTLLNRSTKGVSLTDEGKFLYQRAVDIVALIGRTKDEVQVGRNNMFKTLRLGTISSSAAVLLQHRIKAFIKENPNVRFEIYEGNTYELLDKLKNGIIEAAILRTPFNSDNLHCSYLESEPLAAVARPEFFNNNSKTIRLSELSLKPLIFYRRLEGLLRSSFEREELDYTVFCLNDDARTSLLWARAGLGIALVPYSISGLFKELTVKIIDCEHTVTRLAAVYQKNTDVSSVAKRFVDMFEKDGEKC